MKIPELKVKFPEPGDPEYGTATTPYEIKALLEWAEQVQQFLKELHAELRNKGVID